MDDPPKTNTWSIGSVQLQRVPYFDIALDADSIDLDGVAESIDWSEPWLTDGRPTVGQAFWVIRSDGRTILVDPCGASDVFLRSGADAVTHQQAAFGLLRAAGCEPEEVHDVVLTHLDGIGMAALADGAAAGEETWSPAFPHADLLVSEAEYDYIINGPDSPGGEAAFRQLDAQGAVRAVATPYVIAEGVTLRETGAHSPGHCCIDIASGDGRAALVGHLAISPLHAAAGVSSNHHDPEAAWAEFTSILDRAVVEHGLVAGSLWPAPGAARVAASDPYRLLPASSDT